MAILIILTFILAPTYVMRFGFFGLPTNFLMLWVFLVWLIFFFWLLTKKRFADFLFFLKKINGKILAFSVLFFLSGLIALFIKGVDRAKLGQFIVLFLQPISLFFIASFVFKQNSKSKDLLLVVCYLLLAATGAFAILQYFSLIGLPKAYWGNSLEPKRALSFFVHPNFYALWAGPLLAFLIPDVFQNLKHKILNLKSFTWFLGAIGLLLSLSRAGWLGLAAAIAVYTIVAADKKIRQIILSAVIIMVIIIITVPNLRWRFLLPFYGEKSAGSRIELWSDGFRAVKESPILGLGLTGFAKNYGALNTDPSLDTHNFPHNIFLNFWVETGLLGLISFVFIAWLYIARGLKPSVIPEATSQKRAIRNLDSRFRGNDIVKLGVALFLIALISQGLIDNPYFKNDLALVFWIILALT